MEVDAEFLGQTTSVAQRWAEKSEMPVFRQGRQVFGSREEINRWLGRESGDPIQIATAATDLTTSLKRGLSCQRAQKKPHKPGGKN